ncbi:MAG: FAD-binding oxidoreductase, partial [Gammaproteobacteria bacterium]
MQRYNFLVVGAGIAGASIAYELSRNARVCLIEGESRPGLHTTGRSAALFAPTYGGREFRAITRASRFFFDHPPEGFCEHPLLQPRGCLYIAREDQIERLGQMLDTIRASGGQVNPVDKKDALAQVPLLRESYLAQAAMDADAMDIDVEALSQGFLRGARAAGARLATNSWVTKVQRQDGLWTVELNDGTVSAPVLVNTAGAWADEVAATCGARP